MISIGFRLVPVVFLTAAAALAHFTWVFTADSPLEVGKTVTLGIAHGHKFPQSEEAVGTSRSNFFVIAPSGARTQLQPAVSGMSVTATYAVKERGLHRIVLIQDRGVSSRTPSGVKSGGRDQHPNATQSYRTFRSAVAYASTPDATGGSAGSAGLEFELTGQYKSGAWQLQLLKAGKPVPDVNVEVFLAGAAQQSPAGRSGPDGKLEYRTPAQSKGPVMFSVELRQPPPAGEKYDFVNYATSLYVNR